MLLEVDGAVNGTGRAQRRAFVRSSLLLHVHDSKWIDNCNTPFVHMYVRVWRSQEQGPSVQLRTNHFRVQIEHVANQCTGSLPDCLPACLIDWLIDRLNDWLLLDLESARERVKLSVVLDCARREARVGEWRQFSNLMGLTELVINN
jgi:hypothetical protein